MRNHVVHVSESNLITIAGGKWTTYRVMAQETVDTAVQVNLQSFYPITLCCGSGIWDLVLFVPLVSGIRIRDPG